MKRIGPIFALFAYLILTGQGPPVKYPWLGSGGFNNPSTIASAVASQVAGLPTPYATPTGILNGVYNVKDPAYGAKGDCVTDDRAAIQAAYAAACAARDAGFGNPGTASVFLPGVPGNCYRISKPIISSCKSPIPIIGDSPQTSQILTAGNPNYFPEILNYPVGYVAALGTITAASLATGSGNSLLFPQAVLWYLMVSDVLAPQALNGLTAFTFEGYFNWKPNGNATYTIFSSGGNDGANPNATNGNGAGSQHITIQVDGDGSVAGEVEFWLDIAGTENGIQVNTALTKNVVHHIAAVLDPNAGSPIMRLFIDGTSVGTHNVTGGTTIKQQPDEGMELGAAAVGSGQTQWPDGGTAAPWMGNMDSIRISKVARYTTNFSNPTAKFTSDNNTLFLNNFVNVGTLASPATALIPTDTPANGQLVVRTGVFATQGAAAVVKHLGFNGGAYNIMTLASPQSIIEDVTSVMTFEASFYLAENSYSSLINRVEADNTPIAIATVDTANAQITNFQSTGATYGYIAQTGGFMYGEIISPGTPDLGGLSLSCMTNTCDYLISGVGIDTESGSAIVPVKISGNNGNFVLNDVDMQTASGINQPAMYVNTSGAGVNITLEGVHAEVGNATAEVIHTINSAPYATINWVSPMVNGKTWVTNTIPATETAASPFVNIIGGLPSRATVANLPACGATMSGLVVNVTDCGTCATNSSCVHSGAPVNLCSEYCDGVSAWIH